MLSQAEIDRTAGWASLHAGAVFFLYGAFGLQVKEEMRDKAPWDRAFRELNGGEVAPPLIWVRLGRNPVMKTVVDVTLMSRSTVWVSGGDELGGAVGPAESKENRKRLVSLVGAMVDAEKERLIGASLRVEGSLFVTQQRELREALAAVRWPRDVTLT